MDSDSPAMTIPVQSMDRALDAMEQSEALETCGCRDCKRVQLNAALPILHEAIREELVQEMIAEVEGQYWIDATNSASVDIHFIVRGFLARYLPEREPQP